MSLRVCGVCLLSIILFISGFSCTGSGAGNSAAAGTYTLSVVEAGPGSVEIEPSEQEYHAGDNVTLTAVPESGCNFDGWTGDVTGATASISVVMEKDLQITALFCVVPELDRDGDGVENSAEDTNRDGDYENDDTDGDGIADYRDEDDDGDGVLTKNELGANPDNPSDQDGDLIPDYLESALSNPDDDDLSNQFDEDDDGDGVNTVSEDVNGNGWPLDDDTDGDGVVNAYDDDDDGDGTLTCAEPAGDPNGNGIPAFLDPTE